MSHTSRLLQLLEEDRWDRFQPLMDQLKEWTYYPLFLAAARNLNRDALFVSRVHGEGHIERVLLHGAFCAMENGLDETDTGLLLDACSYHDVGRISDWLDYEHGHRSALQLADLTGRTGQELVLIQAAVDAHSRKDADMDATLASYHPEDFARCKNLAELLKDADGLDRVRIQDLDIRFLRRPGSKARAPFAQFLFDQYPKALPSLFKMGPIRRPALTLSGGLTLPSVGFGTYRSVEGSSSQVLLQALEAGYRYVDTAAYYGNEEGVGEALRKSGIPRDQVILASKIWKTDLSFPAAQASIDASLKRLGTDYLDICLIHWPRPDPQTPNWRELDLQCWRAMERACQAGKIRVLGVSNFLPQHLYSLWELAERKPELNQLEFHPGYPQKAAVDFCQIHGIQVQAWSPLGRNRLWEEPLLHTLAEKYHRTPAQICLRFALECGVQPLPASTNPQRMRENLDLFDFSLSDGDLYELLTLPQLGWSGQHPDR